MIGVEVWLRTKNRSLGTWKPMSPMASQRISALVSCSMNHSGGSGLTIPETDGSPPAVPASSALSSTVLPSTEASRSRSGVSRGICPVRVGR